MSVSPSFNRTVIGSLVKISCSSIYDIEWNFYTEKDYSSMMKVYEFGEIDLMLMSRYQIKILEWNEGWKDFILVINPVVEADSGKFVCIETENYEISKSSLLFVYSEFVLNLNLSKYLILLFLASD